MTFFGKSAQSQAAKLIQSKNTALVGLKVKSNDRFVYQLYMMLNLGGLGGEWDLVYTDEPTAPTPLVGRISELVEVANKGYPESNPYKDPWIVNRALIKNLQRMESVLKQQGAEIVFFKPYESSNIETWPPSKEPKNRDLPP